MEDADPGLRDASSMNVAVSLETQKAEALIAANVSVASITAQAEKDDQGILSEQRQHQPVPEVKIVEKAQIQVSYL